MNLKKDIHAKSKSASYRNIYSYNPPLVFV